MNKFTDARSRTGNVMIVLRAWVYGEKPCSAPISEISTSGLGGGVTVPYTHLIYAFPAINDTLAALDGRPGRGMMDGGGRTAGVGRLKACSGDDVTGWRGRKTPVNVTVYHPASTLPRVRLRSFGILPHIAT